MSCCAVGPKCRAVQKKTKSLSVAPSALSVMTHPKCHDQQKKTKCHAVQKNRRPQGPKCHAACVAPNVMLRKRKPSVLISSSLSIILCYLSSSNRRHSSLLLCP
ncbi:hypothetical protein AMTRI_Chr01g104340 [Amborella trichopoda]